MKLPIHFEFNEYLKMFDAIKECHKQDIDVDLIISTHPYSSGYWIELPGQDIGECDHRYAGFNMIKEFEKRLINELCRSAKEERLARFTL